MKLLVATTIGRTASAFLTEQIVMLSRDHELTVMAAQADEISARIRRHATIAVAPWSRPMRPDQIPGTLQRVRRFLRTGRFDVVYVHTAIAAGLCRTALIGRRERPRVVYCAHGFDGAAARPFPRRTFSRMVERSLSRWTDVVIVMNDEDEQWARSLSTPRVVRVPSVGIDLERYAPDRDSNVSPTGLLVIAELSHRKRVALAIEALALLPQRVSLTIVGDGALRPVLEELATDLGVSERVTFTGNVPDPRPFIQSAAALLSCSSQEGLSRSVLEALAMGTPVVGIDARGVTELLREVGGVVVATPDAAALAGAVDDLFSDAERREQLISRGLEVAARHDVRRIASLFVSVLEATSR